MLMLKQSNSAIQELLDSVGDQNAIIELMNTIADTSQARSNTAYARTGGKPVVNKKSGGKLGKKWRIVE